MEGFVHPDFAPVASKVQSIMSGRRASGGMAVAVYHHGEPVVDVWTGVRNAAGDPWERDTMATCFSTTKGVVATVVHRLVDRGLLDYDVPVATYWPDFGAAGKEQITLRHLLTHQSAMHDVRRLADSTGQLLDWDYMVKQLAAAPPVWPVGVRSGYHALTYGWLVGEVIRRVTGLTIDETFQREIVEPLGLDGGMYVGAPEAVRDRIAPPATDIEKVSRLFRLSSWLSRYDFFRPLYDAMVIDDYIDYSLTPRIHDGEIPAANGVFTARSLARMYAAMASPDAFDGEPFISSPALAEATRVQWLLGPNGHRTDRQPVGRDAVIGFNMRWRLGYHGAFTSAGILPRGFGHFGFGGSGAWADPDSGLAVAMILNQIGGSPFGDTKMLRIGGAAVRAAKRRSA
jgi:CubicO group peptidase (beta-lactamase class C family)